MRNKRGVKIVIIGALFGCCLVIPAAAAQEKSVNAPRTSELAALTAAIDNLAAQLAQKSGDSGQDINLRKLDIAISYLNFRSRRIEMFERELQTMRTSRNRLDDMVEQLRQEEESLTQAFGSGQPDVTRKAREDLRFRKKVILDRIERFDSEIVMLENRVSEMQHQIDNVESFVQKNMKF
jgi:prefoldin subunit 5